MTVTEILLLALKKIAKDKPTGPPPIIDIFIIYNLRIILKLRLNNYCQSNYNLILHRGK
jgi:hypothetical protein